jgi:hypothetical protein
VERLTSDASLEEQIGILIGAICPQSEDPASCEMNIPLYWPEIARAAFPKFLEPTGACTQLGSCMVRDWTCDDCTAGISGIAGWFVSEDYVTAVITFLQGEGFCDNHTEDGPDCAADMDEFMRAAMPVLSAVFVETAPEICQDIAGVC